MRVEGIPKYNEMLMPKVTINSDVLYLLFMILFFSWGCQKTLKMSICVVLTPKFL